MAVTIQIDLSRVEAMLATMRTEGPQVLIRTINNTLKGAKTDISKEIRADLNITAKFLNKQTGKDAEKTFEIFYANKAQLPVYSGKISTKSANVPMIEYSNQRGTGFRTKKKVSVLVKKARSRKTLSHVFPMKMKSGHIGLFEIEQPVRLSRTGRPTIKQKYGPRVPDIMSNKETIEDIQTKINTRMDNELTRQLDYMLSIFR